MVGPAWRLGFDGVLFLVDYVLNLFLCATLDRDSSTQAGSSRLHMDRRDGGGGTFSLSAAIRQGRRRWPARKAIDHFDGYCPSRICHRAAGGAVTWTLLWNGTGVRIAVAGGIC